MKIKVSEATNIQLDWLVAKCEGVDYASFLNMHQCGHFHFSTDWAEVGPILDREHIGFDFAGWGKWEAWDDKTMPAPRYTGPTPLIAAMCCLVASKLSDEVEIPEEL